MYNNEFMKNWQETVAGREWMAYDDDGWMNGICGGLG
jgi:hypothetical protein